MANIRIDVDYTIKGGTELVFRSPCDCTEITGLIVYYATEDGTASKEFALADAHGENVGDIPHLFVGNVVVKVILDVDSGMAFVQNADTNAYLEAQFAGKAPIDHTHTASDVGAAPAGYGLGGSGTWVEDLKDAKNDLNDATKSGFYCWTNTAANTPFGYGSLLVLNRGGSKVTQIAIDPFMSGYGQIAVRHCTVVSSNTWTAWEFINPPMNIGTEYRTTERYKGKVVYTKLVDLGALPNNTVKSVAHKISETATFIGFEVFAKQSTSSLVQQFPLLGVDGTTNGKALVNASLVEVYTFANLSAYTGHAILRYIKD